MTKSEVADAYVWIIFDDATRVAEVICLLVRFFDKDTWTVKQRLIKLKLLKGSLDGEQLLKSNHVHRYAQEHGNQVQIRTRNHASVRHVRIKHQSNAMNAAEEKYQFTGLLVTGCNSHTFDGRGGRAESPFLQEFWNALIQLMPTHTLVKHGCL